MYNSSKIIYDKTKKHFCPQTNTYTNTNQNKFTMPIRLVQKVCGFDVNTLFHIENTKNNKWIYSVEILSKKIKVDPDKFYKFFSYKKKYSKLLLKNINGFFNELGSLLKLVSFNKLTGIFEMNQIEKSKSNSKNISNLTLNSSLTPNSNLIKTNECCVCWDVTMTKTSCSHFICLDCWTKLTNKSNCPYCRCSNIKIAL